jgi:catechol 2,3-dioxygenase-like lactoylglutathione lyase family enzyme
VQPGSADLCFLSETPVREVRDALREKGVELVSLGAEESEDGVVRRTGARGKLESVYVRDPDGNLVE